MTPTSAPADGPVPPASTHTDALALFRRPFAPGAIGFRAMSKVPYNGDPWGGAQVAAYIGAQSVLQRLNRVVPAEPTVLTPAAAEPAAPASAPARNGQLIDRNGEVVRLDFGGLGPSAPPAA